jgi:hypothetical protein
MRTRATLGFLLVVLVAIAGSEPALATVKNETVKPGEEKVITGFNKGDILRIYCDSKGESLSLFFEPVLVSLTDLTNYKTEASKGIAKFEPKDFHKGGLGVAVNIFCAPNQKGPWRWLDCVVGRTPARNKSTVGDLKLRAEKELDGSQPVYLFEIRFYVGEEYLFKTCATRGERPVLVFRVFSQDNGQPAVDAGVGQQNSGREEESIGKKNYYSERLTASAKKFALVCRLREEVSPSSDLKRYYLIGDMLDLPSRIMAFADCVEVFATAAKQEPKLTEPANTVIKEANLFSRYLQVNYERLSKKTGISPSAVSKNPVGESQAYFERNAQFIQELKPFLEKLAQALEKVKEAGESSK